ncbi:hypothetical protein Tco_0242791 [Tanacetum coccineum]
MMIRSLAGMDTILPILQNIIAYLQPMAHQRNIRSVIGRLLVAAASYCIWMERNCRTFKNVRRTPEEVRDSIITIVRLKLLTCRFKNTTMVNELLARWKMPRNFRGMSLFEVLGVQAFGLRPVECHPRLPLLTELLWLEDGLFLGELYYDIFAQVFEAERNEFA